MSDAELSLAVANIMNPSGYWKNGCFECGNHLFNHTTDDALGKMCVWYAAWLRSDGYDTSVWTFTEYLVSDSPHRAIAEAIVETSNES